MSSEPSTNVLDQAARRSIAGWLPVLGTLVFLLLADQWTKSWAREALAIDDRHFLGGLFQLHLAENSGAFLSMGASWEPRTRFIVFSVGVGIFLMSVFWQLRLRRRWTEEWGLILLLAGGIGNLIDRVYKNSVTDFMFIDIGIAHTGVFNVADMVIVASVLLLLLPKRWFVQRPAETPAI